MIGRIELDPSTTVCKLHYRINTGELRASPRGFEPRLTPGEGVVLGL